MRASPKAATCALPAAHSRERAARVRGRTPSALGRGLATPAPPAVAAGRRVPVVVVEEPFAGRHDRDEVTRDGNVTIVRPVRRRGWSLPLVDDGAIASARACTGSGNRRRLLYTPMMLELADAFAAAPLVFDCMDELAAFDGAPAGIAERDRALVDRADLVFTGGLSLYERAGVPARKCAAIPAASSSSASRRTSRRIRCRPSCGRRFSATSG